ncbi:gamma-tubulin complex component 4 isoform X2 [Bacillus rossius redtenbacheri]|uniref:gamma-tubulin complex component 4 isoform X2 n=1 Tax=Bacillus rossius redtenbacheri TaxID=93214 RepID=UPI002FDD5BE6
MIHEAIAALLGYEGNFFANDIEAQTSVLDFHPGEIQLLKKIHSLGSKYKLLKNFAMENAYQFSCRKTPQKECDQSEVEPHAYSMYMHAFCNGLSCLLQPYVDDVTGLEDKALRDPHFTVSDLVCRVHKYEAVFRALVAMTDEVTQQNICGIHLLTYLKRKLNTCIGEERTSVECLLHYCHKVLLKQLTSWLLYGCVLDSHDAFFVQRKQKRLAESCDWATEDSAAPSTVHQGVPGSSVYSTTASTVRLGASGSSQSSQSGYATSLTAGAANCAGTTSVVPGPPVGLKTDEPSGISTEDDVFQYEICAEKLPSYIPPSLAHKILFIGETIMMFGGNAKQSKDAKNGKHRNGDALVESADCNAGLGHAVWGDRELQFLHRLRELQNAQSLNVAALEEVVDDIRMCLAQHLWQLAVDKAELFTQFRLIKDFFLLGRGELFLEFNHLASNILQKTPTSKSEREVNSAFQIAARKVLLNDESAMDKFKFHLPVPSSPAPAEDLVKGWSVVGLTYKVTWPLHFIFTKPVLRNYNELFRFLLRVKKVEMELHSIWIEHLQSRIRCRPDVWQLHRNLMFLVDNLQYYLQVDVLESQYTQLQARISDTKDFEVVKVAHAQFQTKVLSQSFLLTERCEEGGPATEGSLHNNSVHKCLCLFLELCEEFCGKVGEWSAEGAWDGLDVAVQRCNWLTRLLLEMLAGLRTHPCGTYLSQLLLRLDFNRWFERRADTSSASAADISLASSLADSAP